MAKSPGLSTHNGFSSKLRKRLGGKTSVERKREPFLTLWPNGQFSLSYKWTTEGGCVNELDEWRFIQGVGYQRSSLEAAPPNLVSSPKSSQPESESGRKSKKYGLKGISRFGCKMVRSAAYMLQKEFGRTGLTFMTLTVPTLEHAERKKVALRWGEIMRQVIQRLSRLLERAGQPKLVVSVTELQSSRLKKYGQAYLHAHLVFPARCRKSKSWCVNVSDFRTWYKSLIERISGVDLSRLPRVETKVVRSSVEGYLGKYMTKGREGMQGVIDDIGEESVPGQQWNMSKDMRDLVKSSTIRSESWGDYMQLMIEYHVCGESQIKSYLKRVEIDIGGRIITTAWVGNLTEKERDRLGLPSYA